MKPLTLDQAAMYMTLFYNQNMDKSWNFVFPDICCNFRGLKIGDFELEKQKMAKGWKLKKKDFEVAETCAVKMTDEARKTLLVAYQKRKQDEIMHPFLNEL